MAKKSSKSALVWNPRREFPAGEGYEAEYRSATLKVSKWETGGWQACAVIGSTVVDPWGTIYSTLESAKANAQSIAQAHLDYVGLSLTEVPLTEPEYINRVEFLERVTTKHTWVGETTSREEVRYKGEVLGKGIVGARNPVQVARMPDGTIELFFRTDDGCWRLGNIPRSAVRFYVD